MAFVDDYQLDMEPLGAGYHGILKVKSATLAAGTPEEVRFGKFKLVNYLNAVVVMDMQTTGEGLPDTTIALLADGEGITLTDTAGGNYNFAVMGKWTLI